MELQERARELYVPGVFGYKRVAVELGVSHSTVRRFVNPDYAERQRKLSREAKHRRKGTCEGCGKVTSYNGDSVNGPSRFCVNCAMARMGREQRGKGKNVEKVLAALARRPHRFMEIADMIGGKNFAGPTLDRLLKYGLIVRAERGLYTLP